MRNRCISCGNPLSMTSPYVFKTKAFRNVYADESLHECAACGLVQAQMQKVDSAKLGHYYEHQYRSSGIAVAGPAQLPVFRARARALVGLINRHAKRPIERVFEVGAGYGFNLLEAASTWPSARLSTDEVDSTIKISDRIERTALSGPYDAVIASHVLEHFTDPLNLLGRIKSALAPGGVLVIEVPNETPAWIRDQPFHEPHLTFFSAASLRTLLQRAGLNAVEVYTAGPTIQPVTAVTRLKRAARSALASVPGLRAAAGALRGSGPDLDFSQPNPEGCYLRAVVSV